MNVTRSQRSSPAAPMRRGATSTSASARTRASTRAYSTGLQSVLRGGSARRAITVTWSFMDVPPSEEPLRDQSFLQGLALERLAEVRMRDPDQRPGALGDRLALQVDAAVLGDDVHHVGARRGDHVAGGERRDDAALARPALVVGRREAHERLPALRGVGAAHELELPAGAGEVAIARRLRRRLSLQVDLGRVVDRDDLLVLHDVLGQVRVVDGPGLHVGVAVDEGVLAAGAGREREHDLVAIERLPGTGYEAGFHEVDHAVDQHLGVDAEV